MMFAMAMRHLQLMGFPKTVYNADLIGNWSNEIGQAIGVRGLQPGQSISQVAYNLQPADMSNQILTVIDRPSPTRRTAWARRMRSSAT